MKKNQMKITKIKKVGSVETTQNGISKGEKVTLLLNDKESQGFFAYGTYVVHSLHKSRPDLLFYDVVDILNELTNSSIKVQASELYPSNNSRNATSNGISLGEKVILITSGHRVDDLKENSQYIVVGIDKFSSKESPSEQVGLWDEEYSKIKWYKLSDCRPVKSVIVNDDKIYDFGDIARLEMDGRVPIGTKIINTDTSHTYIYESMEDGTYDFVNVNDDTSTLKSTLHNFSGTFLVKIPIEKSYFIISPLYSDEQKYLNYNRITKQYMPGNKEESLNFQTKFRESELNALKRVYGESVFTGYEIKEVER